MLVLVFAALSAPRTLYYLYIAWARGGGALGWLNSRIILNLLFFLIFVPAGLIARAFKWDPLKRTFDSHASSYRIRSPSHSPADMEKPY